MLVVPCGDNSKAELDSGSALLSMPSRGPDLVVAPEARAAASELGFEALAQCEGSRQHGRLILEMNPV